MKNKTITLALLLIAAPFLYVGCQSASTRGSASAAIPFRASNENKVAAVTISMATLVSDKDNQGIPLFDAETLRKHVEVALDAKGVLDPEKTGQIPVVDIVVTNVHLRSHNTALWTPLIGNLFVQADSIDGDVVIRDANNNVIDRFTVSTSYSPSGVWGQDFVRMGWLYDAFAKEAVKELLNKKIS